jgi:hypothetical protein
MKVGFGRDEPFGPRAEEEAEEPGNLVPGRASATGEHSERQVELMNEMWYRAVRSIEELLENEKDPRERRRLLDRQRKLLTLASGGRVLGTENIVYSLLVFSAVLIVVLACLTAFSSLPAAVTTTFVGTVVGGLLATVAQKLGRL